LLAVIPQFSLRHNMGGIVERGIHAVKLNTTSPGRRHETVAPCLRAVEDLLDLLDVLMIGHSALPKLKPNR
jgi:hypothetical protein